MKKLLTGLLILGSFSSFASMDTEDIHLALGVIQALESNKSVTCDMSGNEKDSSMSPKCLVSKKCIITIQYDCFDKNNKLKSKVRVTSNASQNGNLLEAQSIKSIKIKNY